MTLSTRTISIFLLVPIICISLLLISLNQIDEVALYQQITNLNDNVLDHSPKRALHITKRFLPNVNITISDKIDYKIQLKFDWISLLKLSPRPTSITLTKLGKISQNISIKQLEEIIRKLKIYRIRKAELINSHSKLKLIIRTKSTQMDINTSQYQLNGKLYLKDNHITGGKATLNLSSYNILDGIAPPQLLNTQIYTPNITLQFKFINGADKISIKKIASNHLNLNGQVIIPHDLNKMAQIVLNIPTININDLLARKPSEKLESRSNYYALQSLLPNNSVYIHTKIGTVGVAEETISNLSFKLLNTNEEKQISLTGTFPSQETFTFKSNYDYATGTTLYKSNGSHYNVNQFLDNNNDTAQSTLIPIHWNVVADATQKRFNLSDFSIQMEAANIKGNDIITLENNLPVHDAQLKITNVTIDKQRYLPLFTNFVNYIADLTVDMQEEQYLQKYVPLRNINASGKVHINYKDVELWGTELGTGEIGVTFAPSQLSFPKIQATSANQKILANLDIDAIGFTPKIHFNILEGQLDFKNSSELGKKIFNNLSATFAGMPVEVSGSIRLNKVNLPPFSLNNLFTTFNFAENYLSISDATAQIILQDQPIGSLKTNSSIKLGLPLKITSSFAMINSDIARILPLSPLHHLPFKSGWANIVAKANLATDSYDELFQHLTLTGNITSSNLTVHKMNLDSTLAQINNLQYQPAQLYNDLAAIIGYGSTTLPYLKTEFDYQNNVIQAKNLEFRSKYSAGKANIAYSLLNNSVSMKASLSFEVTQPAALRNYNRVIRSIDFVFNGNEQKGYNTNIEAESLYDTLIASRGIIVNNRR